MKSYSLNIKQVKTYLKKYLADMILLAFFIITVISQYDKPDLNVDDYYHASRQTWEIIGEKFYGKKNYYIIKNSDGIKYLTDEKNLSSHIRRDVKSDISFGVDEDIGVSNDLEINKGISIAKDMSITKDISINKDISTGYDSETNEYSGCDASYIKRGDVFVSDIKLVPFKKAGLRGEYNELKYFYSQGIFSKAELSNVYKIKNGAEWREVPRIIRCSISELIEKYPEESENFLNRMILGNSYADYMNSFKNANSRNPAYEKDYIVESMQKLGVSHLLAISGLHINFLYSFLIFVLSFIPVSRGKLDSLCIGILLLYAWILDFSASVIRVILFITVKQLSMHFKFNVLRRRRILFCLDLILLFQPYRIYDIGLRLSFLASMAIDFSEYLQKLKPISNRWLRNIRLTFWINMFTLPVIIDNIGEISLAVFLGNLLIIPIYSLIFITGAVSILFQFVPILNIIARWIFSFSYSVFSYLINGLTVIPFPKLRVIGGLSESEIIIYYIAVFAIYAMVSKRMSSNTIFTRSTLISGRKLYRQKVIYFKVMIVISVFVYFNSFFIPYAPTITMLDIGQGDSFLFSYNGINFLFDTGGEIKWDVWKNKNDKLLKNDLLSNKGKSANMIDGDLLSNKGKSVNMVDGDLLNDELKSVNTVDSKENEIEQGDLLAKELLRRGIRKLDGVFISHRDYDHVGNLKKLSEYIELDKIYCSYNKDGTIPTEYFDKNLEEKIIALHTGDEVSACNNGIKIKVIDAGTYDAEDANSEAMMLVLDYGIKILFTGDRKVSDFPDLTEVGDVDILKVAHHGSKTGTDNDVLEKITPEIAIISCGMGNMYGHPHKSVIDSLKENSIDIYRTDFDGTVELKLFKSIFGEKYLSVKTAY